MQKVVPPFLPLHDLSLSVWQEKVGTAHLVLTGSNSVAASALAAASHTSKASKHWALEFYFVGRIHAVNAYVQSLRSKLVVKTCGQSFWGQSPGGLTDAERLACWSVETDSLNVRPKAMRTSMRICRAACTLIHHELCHLEYSRLMTMQDLMYCLNPTA